MHGDARVWPALTAEGLICACHSLQAPNTDSTLLVLKRMCDSPVEASDLSSYGSQTEQGWESPIKDIDLVASDSLEDEEALCLQDPELGHTSSCSSAHSEGDNQYC